MNEDTWRKAEEIFHAALVLAPEARQAFLDDSCSGDTNLRQRVASLLAHEQRAGRFLETPHLST